MNVLLSTFCTLSFPEEKQKSIDIESICELLNIVLGSNFRQQVDLFVEYLKVRWLRSYCFSRLAILLLFFMHVILLKVTLAVNSHLPMCT